VPAFYVVADGWKDRLAVRFKRKKIPNILAQE